jgi:3-oxoacyl-[acyl-carrier-protein] synthase-3
MTQCYITKTGSFLPGNPVPNQDIERYLGRTPGEALIRPKILNLNGITTRHYALDENQTPTHDLYELSAEAVKRCLNGSAGTKSVDYLSAGSTNTPLVAPGLSSRLHDHLSQSNVAPYPVEISSSSGICSSGAQAFVNATRAVKSGDVERALCVGAEQPSAILNSKVFRPFYDFLTMWKNMKSSRWFMSVFLKFMLSDGAGAFLLEDRPRKSGLSYRIDWTYSRSFANETPLCMNLQAKNMLLSQDVNVLSKHILPYSKRVVSKALEANGESLSNYTCFLPHMSSYYFAEGVQKIMRELTPEGSDTIPYWTNLKSAGNTGSASIYIMLDEFVRTHDVKAGERLLLFVPESGQFNYVVMSLTAVEGSHG